MTLLDLARGALTDNAASDGEPKCAVTAADRGEVAADPATERRRAKALALLAEHLNWRRVVIAEAGDPVIVGIAGWGIGYGELEIPAGAYDVATLLALLDTYGREDDGRRYSRP